MCKKKNLLVLTVCSINPISLPCQTCIDVNNIQCLASGQRTLCVVYLAIFWGGKINVILLTIQISPQMLQTDYEYEKFSHS